MNTTNNDSPGSPETIFPADPRITAYAFGELEGDELIHIENAVNADPALQAAVAELRGFGGQLTTALGEEQTAGVENEHSPAPAAAVTPPVTKKRRGLRIPFPLHYLATAAAACFAMVVWVRQEPTALETKSELYPAVCEAPAGAGAVMEKRAMRPESPAAPLATVAAVPPAEAPSVIFDQTLAGGKSATAPGPIASGGLQTGFKAAASAGKSNGDLVAVGRSQHLGGDAVSADATSKAVPASDADNPQAKVVRIETDQHVTGDRARVRTGIRMQEEAAAAWQRPDGYSAPIAPVPAASSDNFPSARLGVTYKSDAVARAGKPSASGIRSGLVDARFDVSNEGYADSGDNAYRTVAAEPLSTFSVDVDTASYANIRRFLTGGTLPPREAVRIEELINYFPYRYAPPVVPPLGASLKGEVVPFAAKLEVASAPWAPAHRLVRIGIKGREFTATTRPSANLVFLIDVSGSMSSANKLPLVKESLRMLVGRLRSEDRVAIVTYAGSSGLALPSTPASRKAEILAALDNLDSGGATNGAMGIHLAYDIAKANFVGNGGLNRVILCTDGDFNVGVTSRGELTRLIEEKAKSRVFLSVFGFGMGNLKDATLESLAGKGNGAYGYIDTRREAEKVFVEQVEGTLATIAKDVKIQVEFNPARVASYRLIGYENRLLAKEDFNNDAVDAGDIGAGHTVTALYEIVPAGADADGGAAGRPVVDALKYQGAKLRKEDTEVVPPAASKELLTVKIRYKAPEGDVSKKQEFTLTDTGAEFAKADGEFQFAAAVAAWGMLLRESPHKGTVTFEQVLGWAENGLGEDAGGYRAEFIQLVRRSAELGNR